MSFSAPESILSNLHDYDDAELYDLENPEVEEANQFLLALAQETGGAVLELGCGTGRFTIPLARQGIDVTGVDLMPGMLARARQKSRNLPAEWIEADARSFHLDRRFGLIFDVGEAFIDVFTRTDHEAILARVHEHLEPGGLFVLTLDFPNLHHLQARAEHHWLTYEGPQGQPIHLSGTTGYDAVGQIYHEDAVRRWQDAAGEAVERFAPLARRRFFPQELEMLLHYNGFSILHRYGNYDRSPLTAESPLMIFVCQSSKNQPGRL